MYKVIMIISISNTFSPFPVALLRDALYNNRYLTKLINFISHLDQYILLDSDRYKYKYSNYPNYKHLHYTIYFHRTVFL